MKYDPFWAKYQWEFMRRNHEFRKAYDELIAYTKDENHAHDIGYINLRYMAKWGFYPGCRRFPNPYNSFEKEFTPEEIQEFFQDCYTPIPGKKYDARVLGETLRIYINIDKLGTVEKIKERVVRDIDEAVELVKKTKDRSKPSKRVDYDIILQVGDLREEGLTYEQIAKTIFPRDFNEQNINAKPESAIRKAGQYFKRYQELTEYYQARFSQK